MPAANEINCDQTTRYFKFGELTVLMTGKQQHVELTSKVGWGRLNYFDSRPEWNMKHLINLVDTFDVISQIKKMNEFTEMDGSVIKVVKNDLKESQNMMSRFSKSLASWRELLVRGLGFMVMGMVILLIGVAIVVILSKWGCRWLKEKAVCLKKQDNNRQMPVESLTQSNNVPIELTIPIATTNGPEPGTVYTKVVRGNPKSQGGIFPSLSELVNCFGKKLNSAAVFYDNENQEVLISNNDGGPTTSRAPDSKVENEYGEYGDYLNVIRQADIMLEKHGVK